MRVLLTRPEPAASRSHQGLRARGHDVTSVPLMQLEPLAYDAAGAEQAEGFILTSQRAAFALPARGRERPVFAAGTRTAGAAIAQGFVNTLSADGDWQDLARLVRERMPRGARLWHPSGERQRGALADQLAAAGFDYCRTNVYAMRDTTTPPAALISWLAGTPPGVVLFYSPATAGVWRRFALASQALRAVCISSACAAMLRPEDWARIAVADQPNEQALWRCLETIG